MPIRDPEERRRYDREYKRRLRACPTVSNPAAVTVDALREAFDSTRSCACEDCRESCPRCRTLVRRCLRRKLGLLKP